jgi:hypothetical protein
VLEKLGPRLKFVQKTRPAPRANSATPSQRAAVVVDPHRGEGQPDGDEEDAGERLRHSR